MVEIFRWSLRMGRTTTSFRLPAIGSRYKPHALLTQVLLCGKCLTSAPSVKPSGRVKCISQTYSRRTELPPSP